MVTGVTEHHELNWLVGGTAALGTLIAIGLWWIYFDLISQHRPHQNYKIVITWYYLHLPLTIGITTVGASVLYVVEHAGEYLPLEVRWLLLTAIALTLLTTVLLTRTTQFPPEFQRVNDIGWQGLFISAILVILLGFIPLDTIPLLSVITLLLLMPIFFGIRVWVETLGSDEI